MEVDSEGEYDDLTLDFDDPQLMHLLDNPNQPSQPSPPPTSNQPHYSALPRLTVTIEPLPSGPPKPSPLSPSPSLDPAPSHPAPHPDVLPPAPLPNLYDQFRRRRGFGSLSVSDLVAPSWCEVQHSYRLLSHAHLPPAQRPATIVTPAGNTVAVSLSSMVVRDKILTAGTATHARIEKAVMGDVEAIEVEVTGKEEVWALKVVNLMVLLEMLGKEGRVREVPVWGFVGDKLVLGVIDEVERKEMLVGEPLEEVVAAKVEPVARLTPPLDAEAAPLDGALNADEEEALREILIEQKDEWTTTPPPPPPPTRSGFILSDTKTRHNRSLPPPADSRSAKLQLMLYHRLLADILGSPARSAPTDSMAADPAATSPENPADSLPPSSPAARLIAHLGLAADARLSDTFLASIAPLLTDISRDLLAGATTLADFFAALGKMGELLGGGGALHARLEISYVLRKAGDKWGKRRKGGKDGKGGKRGEAAAPATAVGLEEVPATQDEVADAAAGAGGAPSSCGSDASPGLRRSKRHKPNPESALADISDASPSPPGPVESATGANGRPPAAPLEPAKAAAPPPPAPPASTPPASAPAPPPHADPDFIGTEAFAMDDALLDAWLANVMSLWLGERAPRGVSLEQTNRCRGCEFNEDCEWLAAKAEEVRREAEARRRAREAGRG